LLEPRFASGAWRDHQTHRSALRPLHPPCVIRRTALPGRDVAHAVDLTSKKDPHFVDTAARIHVDAYLVWARKLTASKYSPERFAFEAPQIVRQAVAQSDGKLTMKSIFEIERRFADELIKTFPVP
jgi:hypothetical protein